MTPMQVALKILGLILCVYVFVVGIKAMGSSFKLFGNDFSKAILEQTSSPFIGLFIGMLATALVQSSSTTTSVVVGMVAAGALTIQGAIPIIMGANIGTTVTNTLVSMGHVNQSAEFRRALAAATVHDFFNLFAVLILFPLELATGILGWAASRMQAAFQGIGGMQLADPIDRLVKPTVKLLQKIVFDNPIILLILSIALIIVMLIMIVKILRSLMLAKIEKAFDKHIFKNAFRAMAVGFALTVAVQSSSITTSLVIPLAGAGVLKVLQIFPYTMGANVGTTVTAMLAALATGESAAVTVAFTHLLFNLSAIAIIWPFERIRRIPVDCAEWLAARAAERWYVPAVFVGAVFFVAPLTVILATGALPDRKGDKSDIVAASAAAASAPADSATITVIGSDTLVILAKRWAEVYMAGAPGVDVQVNGGGSGVGFAALLKNNADIANASRPIKPQEKIACAKAFKAPPIEARVCLDGLTIYAHSSNPVDALTMEQLASALGGRILNWKELGGPDRPILIYSRENSSGTYEFIKDRVLKGRDFVSGTQYLHGTASVVAAVSRDPDGLGYGGAAYGRNVKHIKLKRDENSEAVAPNKDTVATGVYPLWRHLYVYASPEQTNGPVADYLAWITGPEGQRIVEEIGYFPLSARPAP